MSSDDYCWPCMTEARRIGSLTGQNVSEVYRFYRSGTRHREACELAAPGAVLVTGEVEK